MNENITTQIDLKLAQKFGQIAIEMGFVTAEQVKQVLSDQVSIDSSNRLRPPRLTGEIFFDKGWMTQKQIKLVMERISLESR